jgi:RNA polymerase sigma-70 factor (ECF subfamily)
LSLYDQLLLLKPTPIVAMNRSVALARVRGPREALEALESIPNRHSLEAQHLYHAIRASFIAKLGHPAEARAAYQRAADLAPCDAERDFLQSQASES